jgi:hypothetical protein
LARKKSTGAASSTAASHRRPEDDSADTVDPHERATSVWYLKKS